MNRRNYKLAKGMTLIELLVAVGIMVVMIAGVGFVFSETSRAVRTTQASIDCNANIRAGVARLRQDMQGLTQDGFLCFIAGTAGADGDWTTTDDNTAPVLAFTVSGRFVSQAPTPDGEVANAAMIVYTPIRDAAGGKDILARYAFLLTGTAGDFSVAAKPKPFTADDRLSVSLEDLRDLVRSNMPAFVAGYLEPLYLPHVDRQLDAAPVTIADVNGLWPYVFGGVDGLTFDYYDGFNDDLTTTFTLPTDPVHWVGVFHDEEADDDVGDARRHRADNDGGSDIVGVTDEVEAGYTADEPPMLIWDFRAKAIWPEAVRVRLRLTDVGGRLSETRQYNAVMSLPR